MGKTTKMNELIRILSTWGKRAKKTRDYLYPEDVGKQREKPRDIGGPFTPSGAPSDEMTEEERDALAKKRRHAARLRYKSKYPGKKEPKYSKKELVPEYHKGKRRRKVTNVYDLF